jgi:4-amino-4-deoxy-L-arabinose transferase-like glycosyltransferase
VFTVTPDMLVAAAVFLSSGLLIRLSNLGATPWTAAMFGGALGMAFLAKALVVPIVIVALLLGAATLTRSGRRQHALAAVAGLALVSAPFVIALSRDAGHVSVGDVWKLSYLKYVLHAPYPHYSHGSPNVMGARCTAWISPQRGRP